jgi:hypothetical protein
VYLFGMRVCHASRSAYRIILVVIRMKLLKANVSMSSHSLPVKSAIRLCTVLIYDRLDVVHAGVRKVPMPMPVVPIQVLLRCVPIFKSQADVYMVTNVAFNMKLEVMEGSTEIKELTEVVAEKEEKVEGGKEEVAVEKESGILERAVEVEKEVLLLMLKQKSGNR